MFYVDGLSCNTLVQARVLSNRLFKRYEGYRSIQIKDSKGLVVEELEATKDFEAVDADTIDWISGT